MKYIYATAILIGTTFLFSETSFAASFMKIDGLKGEAGSTRNTVNQQNWIDVDDIAHAIGMPTQPQTGSARQRSRAIAETFTISKPVDEHSPALSRAVATGKVFPKITLKNEVGSKSYSVTLYNARLSAFNQSSEADSWPTETFSLNYERITWHYTEGSTKETASWDFKTGR